MQYIYKQRPKHPMDNMRFSNGDQTTLIVGEAFSIILF